MKIKILDVEFSYRSRKALRGVTLEIPERSFTVLLGPNGAGKTTLLRVVANLLKPKRGVVYIDGRALGEVKDLHNKFGYVPQRVAPGGRIPVFEFLLSSLRPFAVYHSREDVERVLRVVEMLGLGGLVERPLEELSGGELQLVLIARAVVSGPEVVLLDEPLSNLDVRNQIRVMDFLRRLSKEATVVASLHDLNMAYRYGDYAVFLKDGVVYAAGRVAEVFREDVIDQVFGTKSVVLPEYRAVVFI